jgi:hypothetical protein
MPLKVRPLRVEIVGLFPTVFTMCAKCCTTDYVALCNPHHREQQLGEYAPELLDNQLAVERLLGSLWQAAGLRVRPVIVDATSPRGLWLTIQHRLGREPAVVVGSRVVRTLDPEAVLALLRELGVVGDGTGPLSAGAYAAETSGGSGGNRQPGAAGARS